MRSNKAFLLAAGLGTRLKPFTLTNPKALVPVGGVPMLERVILRLKSSGFDDIVINVHHFADKIIDYVKAKESFGIKIRFSDERDCLLDTGGGIYHAREMLMENDMPFLIHNVDILSNASLDTLMMQHCEWGDDATLLVSRRTSSRKLIFDAGMNLKGWHNLQSREFKPGNVVIEDSDKELSFSGIHIMSPQKIFERMEVMAKEKGSAFPVMDFYLSNLGELRIKGVNDPGLELIDIGKPATLSQANKLF